MPGESEGELTRLRRIRRWLLVYQAAVVALIGAFLTLSFAGHDSLADILMLVAWAMIFAQGVALAVSLVRGALDIRDLRTQGRAALDAWSEPIRETAAEAGVPLDGVDSVVMIEALSRNMRRLGPPTRETAIEHARAIAVEAWGHQLGYEAHASSKDRKRGWTTSKGFAEFRIERVEEAAE